MRDREVLTGGGVNETAGFVGTTGTPPSGTEDVGSGCRRFAQSQERRGSVPANTAAWTRRSKPSLCSMVDT